VDGLVEQGYRRLNNLITHRFTNALERNPGANFEDVLRTKLRKYLPLRRKVEERPQKRRYRGLHLFFIPKFD